MKGPELDKVIVDSKLIVYTRGVNGVKHISAKYREVATGKVHHKKYKMQVLKEGELKFYKIGSKYRNIQRCYAQVPYKDWFIEIELERSFKEGGRTMMYIYAPKLDLTAEQLPKEDDIARGIVTDAANYMMKNLGWRLGEVEDTKWQRHIGIDNPALLKGVAEKFYMKSTDGKSWLSNSDGRSELETSDLERAVISLDLPGEIVTLRSTVGGLVEDLKLVVEALSLAKEGMENCRGHQRHRAQDKGQGGYGQDRGRAGGPGVRFGRWQEGEVRGDVPMSADIRTGQQNDIPSLHYLRMLHSGTGFIYRLLGVKPPRISDKKVSSRNTHSSYLRDVRIAYRTVFLLVISRLYERRNDIVPYSTIGPSAAALVLKGAMYQ